MSDKKYLKSIQQNKELTINYYKKSLSKTYQQIFLEESILPNLLKNFEPKIIADIACGGGTLTYHISKIYPEAKYILSDINPDAIELAKKINENLKNVQYIVEDFLNTSIPSESVDIVFCMQTLLAVSRPKAFLYKILDILKPGGYFILSSLFNINHDVDLYIKVKDNTRKGNIKLNYNTFSKITISRWLKNKVNFFDITPFHMPDDLKEVPKGLGSYTLKLEEGSRLTISGGMLMNWGFLYGKK